MSAPTADDALPLLLARSSDRPAQLRAVAVPSALSSSRPPDIPTDTVRRPSTPCLAATSRHLLGSRPPATSPRSRRSPPRRGRGLRIIIVAGDALLLHDAADHDVNVRPVPVTPAAAMAPVNVSVMTIRRGTFTAAPTAHRIRRPRRFATGLLAEPAAPVVALPSLPATPFVPACLSTSASPVRASPVTGFRTSPSSSVRASVIASARASGWVLRTTALSSVCTPHSIAVAAPFRELRPRRFPFAHTLDFVVPDRVPRLWFSHPTQPAVCRALSASGCAPLPGWSPSPPGSPMEKACSFRNTGVYRAYVGPITGP